MIYTAKELRLLGESQYSVKNKLAEGKIFFVEHGLYSDEPNPYNDETFICKKYPKAVLTGLSAFYIYELTDYIPDKFYMATEQHSYPFRRKDVVQTYQDASFFSVGVTSMKYGNGYINIYDLERTLIELIRLKEKYPAELYYEVLSSFRKIKNKLDFYKIVNYSKNFKNGESILQKIKEVI